MTHFTPKDFETGDTFAASDEDLEQQEIARQDAYDATQDINIAGKEPEDIDLDQLAAISAGDGYAKRTSGIWAPVGAIPKADLAATVQASLDAGDIASYWPVEKLASGFITPQRIMAATSLTMVSGRLQLDYFRAPETADRSNITKLAGATPQSGVAPTMIKFGVYSVAGNGDLTKVVQTANDTTLFTVAFAQANKPLLNPTTGVAQAMSFVKGNWYASASLIISTGTLPTLWCVNTSNTFTASSPRLIGALNSQSDLPATITAASLGTVTGYTYSMFT